MKVLRLDLRLVSILLLSLLTLPAFAGAMRTPLPELLGTDPGQREFLRPEQAFVVELQQQGDAVQAHWHIANGYYLYRKQMKILLDGKDLLATGQVNLPHGELKHDEFFGDTEVYHRRLDLLIPQAAHGDRLQIGYQGCAEKGICYPPQLLTARIATLPVASAPAALEPVTSHTNSGEYWRDRLQHASLTLIVSSFFGLGLLLSFTPCVLPMIPILAGVIARGHERLSTRRAFALSLTYVLAMAATYTAAGILAGLFGANLQALAQRPAILVGFSALFVILALAMFGLFELQMPLALQNRLAQLSARQRGGSWIGTATMGLLSALIVGPCMAAPLAGALLYIAQSGDAYLGGLALFSLSLGMGTPLLIIGTSAGRLLPKAGPWMDAVKQLFGVILLAVAVWMLARLFSERITLLLWAMLCLLAAGLLLRSVRQIGSSWRLAGWLGVATLTGCASTLVLASATGADRSWLPLTRLNQSQSSSLHFARIKTYTDLERELAAAAATHQPVMLDFYADWCVECITMARTTFADAAVQRQLAAVRLLQADVTAMDAEDRALLRKLKVLGPPTIVFFDDGGHELPNGRLVGLVDAQDFMRHTGRIFTLADLVDDKHG